MTNKQEEENQSINDLFNNGLIIKETDELKKSNKKIIKELQRLAEKYDFSDNAHQKRLNAIVKKFIGKL